MGRKILLTVLQRGASSSALADARNVHSPQLIHDFESARSLENQSGLRRGTYGSGGLKASIPVTAWPRISVWMSWVPS
jgi:hypothetical protein